MPSDRRPSSWAGAITAFVGLSAVAGLLLALSVTPGVAVTGAAATTGIDMFNDLPAYLEIQPLDQRSTIYAESSGKEVAIATFYAQNRQDVSWDEVSPLVRRAAIDAEDPHFYDEGGVDLTGTIRGALSTAFGHEVQGGSSITQQYVKNVLVERCDSEYINEGASKPVTKKEQAEYESCYQDAAGTTIDRKLREIRYAIGLNKTYTKKEILLGYLNIAGFGGQVYGVQAAAEYYFDTDAKDLTLAESATLAAILNNPSNLRIDEPDNAENGSADHYKLTLARRNYVLDRMLIHKSISRAEYEAAVKEPITPKITPQETGCSAAAKYDAAYFCTYVEDTVLSNPAFGKTVDERVARFDEGGLDIYSTLNLNLQENAQNVLSSYIPSSDPNLNLGASDVSVETGTGRVVTMVQNTSYTTSSSPPAGSTAINFNTDEAYGGSSGFQTGSSFKVFDLTAWLEAGYGIDDVVNASQHDYTNADFTNSCYPIGDAPWDVSNDEGEEAGDISVTEATADSVNTAFAKMATSLDLCNIMNDAKNLDVHLADGTDDWIQYPSMILGTNYIAPLTMATAYAGIANNGVVCTPIAIDKMTQDGTAITVPKTSCTQGISAAIAHGLEDVLQTPLTEGTAVAANPDDSQAIMGKTGTSNNSVENWMVTSTTKVANAVWVGNVTGYVALRDQTFQGIGGGNVKFSIARPILQALNATYSTAATSFPAPPESEITGSDSDPYAYTPTPAPSPTPTPAPTSTATPAPAQ